MTRQETKSMLHEDWEHIIDKIFDDFESRVCKNCKYNNKMCTYQESIKVYCKVTRGEDYGCDFDDFGCNRFERTEIK